MIRTHWQPMYACCYTHGMRDMVATSNGEVLDLVTDSDPERCQCKYGISCNRRMTAETLQCDWCWPLKENGHSKECEELSAEMDRIDGGHGHFQKTAMTLPPDWDRKITQWPVK